jgi:DNA-binding NarL/FixJ family response regulator
MTVRVLIADDQALIRTGLRGIVESAPDLDVVAEATTGREAVDLLRTTAVDVVLMDIRMPDVDGLQATRQIVADDALAGVRVLILTTFELDEYVLQALRAGASGFLGKGATPTELHNAIRTVAGGEALLSPKATQALITRFLTPGTDDPRTAAAVLDVLTDREREVVTMVALGQSNDEIAGRLHLSPATAKTHVNRAMTKLGARDRAQLVVTAYRTGLVRPGDTA